jgi:hypothetical protein
MRSGLYQWENPMRLRGFIPIAVVCIGASTGFGATAVSAVEQTGATPLQLKKFMKSPVSSSATRTEKKADGDYAQLPSQRLKKKAAAKDPEPVAAPIEISSEATSAYAAVMDAQVKVVSEDELNEIDLAADVVPIVPVAVPTSTETVHVVGPNEINAIDQAADKGTVGLAPTAEPDATASSPIGIATEHKSWMQRMIDGLNIVLAAATAAAKALFA